MIELMIMSYSHRALVVLLLYLASSWLFAVVEGQGKDPPTCSRVGDVRANIESERMNGTCAVVNLTNVEVCETDGWREICDADFTDLDARVICRQLNYSDIGAVAGRFEQLFGGFPTTISPVCSGTEAMLSDCSTVASGVTSSTPNCAYNKVSVTCFPKGFDGSTCGVATDTTVAVDGSTTTVPSATPSDSTDGFTPVPLPGSTTGGPDERTTDTQSVITDLQSQSEQQPNIVIILVSVGIVFVLALVVSIVLMVILGVMCYRRTHREKNIQISPDSPVKVRKSDETDSKDLESGMYSELNNSTVAQHQVPIYDTVRNKSQNLSEASVSENNDEDNHTYAALNQDAIYTQITPHLGPGNSSTLPAGLTGLPSASSSFYQKLDRTRSLPRTPGSGSSASFTQTHAVNRTALALESGNIEETDLASPTTSDASVKYPSPRGSPKQRPSPRGSPKQRLSSTHSSASKDELPLTREPMNINPENFYHVLDQEGVACSSASSERDRERYDIDSQVSTDAVCNLGEHDNRQPQCYVGGGAVGGVSADGGPPLYAILEPSARVQLTPPTRHDTRQRSQSAAVKNRSSPPHQKRSFSNSSNREAVHNYSGGPRRTTGKYIQPSFQPNVVEIIDDPQMDTLV